MKSRHDSRRCGHAGVTHDVVTDDVGQRVRVRRRRHVGQVERLDVGGMGQDGGQLGVNVSICSSVSRSRASLATCATSSREIEAMSGPS